MTKKYFKLTFLNIKEGDRYLNMKIFPKIQPKKLSKKIKQINKIIKIKIKKNKKKKKT
jgi:hypothetical protein